MRNIRIETDAARYAVKRSRKDAQHIYGELERNI